MKHKVRITFHLVLLGGAFLSTLALAAVPPEHPNIVLIMADDMGWGDPTCNNPGSKIPTPNIDRLAKEGMRFTDAHSPASVCTPTRYGLLTGRYPMRMDRPRNSSLIAPGRMTLATLLKQEGYRTACIGKWHLGFDIESYDKPLQGGPTDHGFDYFFGMHASLDIPPYYYIQNDRCVEPPTSEIAENHSEGVTRIQGAFWRKGPIAPGFKHIEVLPTFTEKAVSYLTAQAQEDRNQPFFLYLAFPAPHTPWLPSEPFHGASQAGTYGDYAAQVDGSVGQVLAALDKAGLGSKTLVFFTSDNGPVWYPQDSDRYDHRATHFLRGMKGDAWEGGHRMPFVARWPGTISAGSTSNETICFTDMLATFAAIVGTELPPDAGADSYNILPALLGKKGERPIREATIHQSSKKILAIRQGDWKLIPALGSGGFSEPQKEKPEPSGPQGQLYNLAEDPSEQNNLWQRYPDRVKQLTGLLEKYINGDRSVSR